MKRKIKCANCKNEGDIELKYLGKWVCNSCFMRIFEKRFKHTLREYEMIRRHRVVKIKRGPFYKLAKYLFEELGVKVSNKGRYVNTVTLDDQSVLALRAFFECRPELLKEIGPIGKGNEIRPFFRIPREEMYIYAQLKGIKVKEVKKENDVEKFLEKIEEIRPGVKFSIINSILRMKGLR